MRLIRTIICDDEEPARNRIIKLLAKETDFLILAEAKNGEEALSFTNKFRPDLLFLDIQMPDLNGIRVMEKIKPKLMPSIIFTTAYDQYAIKAFELYALDYLLKPFDNKRFEQSLNRLRNEISEREKNEFSDRLLSFVNTYNENTNQSIFLTIRENGIDLKIMIKDIVYIESYSNYLKLFTQSETHLLRSSFDRFIKKYDNGLFLRVHRSYLVNKEFISSIKYLTNHEFKISLINGKDIKSGRHYYQLLNDYFSSK